MFKKQMLSLLAVLLLAAQSFGSPVYSAGSAVQLGSGQVTTVWGQESPTPGNGTTAASQQVALVGNPTTKAGTPFSVDFKFSGAPGVFEVDVQVAASDVDANYQTCSNCNITTVDSTNNTAHLDAVLVNAKFARLLMRSRTNAVSIVATITGG